MDFDKPSKTIKSSIPVMYFVLSILFHGCGRY